MYKKQIFQKLKKFVRKKTYVHLVTTVVSLLVANRRRVWDIVRVIHVSTIHVPKEVVTHSCQNNDCLNSV